MGGTLRRLVEQGHQVKVVYLTSGNLAVPDEEAVMATDLVADVVGADGGPELITTVRRQLEGKREFDQDTPEIRRLKGLLRRGEARASLRTCGVAAGHTVFLDLGFYERGRYRQFKLGAGDVAAVVELLRNEQPHQIFATGHSDDPSSVAAVGFDLVRQACRQLSAESWWQDCRVWLYRGVEREWETAEIDMAVPFSPSELTRKIQAIFHHRSQRSQTPVATGLHEPWQQAEKQNRALAARYDQLGLANYEAIEAFQRWSM